MSRSSESPFFRLPVLFIYSHSFAPFYCFSDPSAFDNIFWPYCPNEIRDISKNELKRETISSCLEEYKTTLHVFIRRNTLISNFIVKWDSKRFEIITTSGIKDNEKKNKHNKSKTLIKNINKEHYWYKIHAFIMKINAYPSF